jgi:pimeloyl-ACP methyl ester carboxylesterase
MSTHHVDERDAAPAPPDGEPQAPPSCRPPADIRREVERYEADAEEGVWEGPRYRMTYHALGSGPPLLWVPGIASTHRSYALVLNRLAERFRTIVYDYPGERDDDGARLARIGHDDLVDDVFGLIEHLRLGRCFLAGISFGSTVTLEALRREPRRFPRAVVQGAFAHRRFTIAERLALAVGRLVPGRVARLPLRERVLTYNSRLDFPRVIEDRWPFYLEENGQTAIRGLAHRSSLLARLDLRPILGEIPTEVLLIQGNEDRIVPRRYFDELVGALPHAEGRVIPTVGHIPHLSHAELFSRMIDEWLLPCNPTGCPREAGEGAGACGGPEAACAGGREAGAPAPASRAE